MAYQPDLHPTTLITGRDAEGRTSRVTITEYYDEAGAPVAAGDPQAVIAVHAAQAQSPQGARDCTLVSGSSIGYQGGHIRQCGPAGAGSVAAARRGRQRPGPAARSGHRRPGQERNRTALAMGIDHGGESATVISTHFSAGEDAGDARRTQYATLGAIAQAYGDNTVVPGDFNSESSALGELGGNPLPWSERIYRIYTSGDVAWSERTHVNGGGSDHDMITWDADLDA